MVYLIFHHPAAGEWWRRGSSMILGALNPLRDTSLLPGIWRQMQRWSHGRAMVVDSVTEGFCASSPFPLTVTSWWQGWLHSGSPCPSLHKIFHQQLPKSLCHSSTWSFSPAASSVPSAKPKGASGQQPYAPLQHFTLNSPLEK